MKSALYICSVALLLFVIAPAVNADIARPKPSPKKVVLNTSLEIVPDPKGYEARLQIQESDLRELRAALDGASSNTTIAAAFTRSSTRTIVAGLLLFLSLSSAGVWLARSKRGLLTRAGRVTAAIVIGASIVGVAAMITRGNAGPPSSFYWRNLPKALTQGRSTTGGVEVEIVPDDREKGRYMRLTIPLKNTKQNGEDE